MVATGNNFTVGRFIKHFNQEILKDVPKGNDFSTPVATHENIFPLERGAFWFEAEC